MKLKFINTWLVLSIVFLSGCSSTTKVVEQWTDPNFEGKLQNLLVLSLSQSTRSRRIIENGFLLELKKRNIQAQASYDLLPDREDLNKETVKKAISGSSIDGVLVMRPVKVTKEDRHVQAQSEGTRYDTFYAYVGEYRPTYDSYTITDTIVHLETNLYVVKGEQLVWTGKTESFNPTDVNELISELVVKVLDQVSKTGFL
jgi:hypothetical protein